MFISRKERNEGEIALSSILKAEKLPQREWELIVLSVSGQSFYGSKGLGCTSEKMITIVAKIIKESEEDVESCVTAVAKTGTPKTLKCGNEKDIRKYTACIRPYLCSCVLSVEAIPILG